MQEALEYLLVCLTTANLGFISKQSKDKIVREYFSHHSGRETCFKPHSEIFDMDVEALA